MRKKQRNEERNLLEVRREEEERWSMSLHKIALQGWWLNVDYGGDNGSGGGGGGDGVGVGDNGGNGGGVGGD